MFHRVRLPVGLVFLVTYLAAVEADEILSAASQSHRIHRRSVDVGAKVGNKTLKIVTILLQPYGTKTVTASGETEWTGFIPDLISTLAHRLHFNYSFYEVPDGKYGSVDQSGRWNGMIGECVLNENDNTQGADIAAAPITVTRAREKVVDFVKPFQYLGLTVIIKSTVSSVNATKYPYSFGIFQPLDPAVWGLVSLSTIIVGLVLWLMNLYNPYEWAGRHAIGLAEESQAEAFNLVGSIWFVVTSLQWQGFDRSPRSIASRFLCAVWFMFVTILLVTYTAGVVNNLFWASMVHKNSRSSAPTYADLGQLLASKEYEIGTLAKGSTYDYLTKVAVGEEFDVLRRTWQSPGGEKLLVNSVQDGIVRVRTSKFAFIMESAMATYLLNQRPCDLQTVGDVFAKRSYGFALPNNSLILEELHAGILQLAEEGEIEAMEKQWFVGADQCWNETRMRGASDAKSSLDVDQPKRVDMDMFWGAIVLLFVGVAISLAIAAAEFIYYRQWGKFNSSNQPRDQELKMDPE